MFWQQYVLLALAAIGVGSTIHNSFHWRVKKYTAKRVIATLAMAFAQTWLVLSVSRSSVAWVLIGVYALGGLILLFKLGEDDVPPEPGGELVVFALLMGLYAWGVTALA